MNSLFLNCNIYVHFKLFIQFERSVLKYQCRFNLLNTFEKLWLKGALFISIFSWFLEAKLIMWKAQFIYIFAQNNKSLKVYCSIELNVLFCWLFFNFSKSELFLFHTTYFHWLVEFRISDVLIVFSPFFVSSSSNSIWIMMMQCVTLWIDKKKLKECILCSYIWHGTKRNLKLYQVLAPKLFQDINIQNVWGTGANFILLIFLRVVWIFSEEETMF